MGLKGYRLWAMGQLDSTCRAPPQLQHALHQQRQHLRGFPRAVALQVAFERQTLKPAFSLDSF
jgi:hypothetical protein